MDDIFQTMAQSCACFYVRKSSREVTLVYDTALSGLGVRSTQFLVLLIIKLSGETPMSQAAETLGIDRTTLTRLVAPLKRRKLLTIVSGKDRRSRWLRLTPSGQQLLIDAVPCWKRAQKKVVSLYGGNEGWESMLSGLKKTSELIPE
jgi:DNA-binding MarR family transcriptional regulator